MTTHKNLPNFLIAGAPKSGTTTLWGWLKQHPSVFMSEKKETHFLIYNCKTPIAQNVGPDSIKSYPEYLELFEDVSSETAIGEASPGYLCDPDVPFEIDKTLPGAKVIAILRDPVERAWSSYKKSLILGEESGKMSFLEALESEIVTDSDPWNGSRRLIRMGLYGEQLTRYFSAVGKERMSVHLYEDLNDPKKLLRQIYEFLQVDPDFLADTKKSLNVTKEVKSEALHHLLSHQSSFRRVMKALTPKSIAEILRKPADKLFSINHTPKPELPKIIRAEAIKYFREDIEKTGDLVSRDLTHWLT